MPPAADGFNAERDEHQPQDDAQAERRQAPLKQERRRQDQLGVVHRGGARGQRGGGRQGQADDALDGAFCVRRKVRSTGSNLQGVPCPRRLGFVDLDLGCSTTLLGQLVATVAAHQPGELPKSKSTQDRSTRTWDALYTLLASHSSSQKNESIPFH